MRTLAAGRRPSDEPELLTVGEAARRYLATDETEALPVIRLGSNLRVPRWAFVELMHTGRVVSLRRARCAA